MPDSIDEVDFTDSNEKDRVDVSDASGLSREDRTFFFDDSYVRWNVREEQFSLIMASTGLFSFGRIFDESGGSGENIASIDIKLGKVPKLGNALHLSLFSTGLAAHGGDEYGIGIGVEGLSVGSQSSSVEVFALFGAHSVSLGALALWENAAVKPEEVAGRGAEVKISPEFGGKTLRAIGEFSEAIERTLYYYGVFLPNLGFGNMPGAVLPQLP